MRHINLINSLQELRDFEEKRNFCEDTLVKPIVGYMPETSAVMYDAHILPENKELWEKFSQIFEDNVTCEDEWLFSTQPMTHEIWNDTDNGIYTHDLIFKTDIKKCLGFDWPNPEYKEFVEGYVTIENTNEVATIDDFIGFGGEHNWKRADCGK